MEKAQIHKRFPAERARAEESVPVARATRRASGAAEQFVVVPRALECAVTDVVRVQTHGGVPTAVETGTQRVVTTISIIFVFTVRAVVDAVTPDEYGETVATPWTLEVGFWTIGGEALEP